MVKSEFTANDLEAVLQCKLFKYCDDDKIINYLNNIDAKVYDFSGNEFIPFDIRHNAYSIIISGSVKIFSKDNGDNPILLNVVNRYEAFDIASLTDDEKHVPLSMVKTAGKCRIIFIPTCKIEALMRDYPEIAANCFKFFCERIEFLNNKIRMLSCGTSEKKLADFLLNEFYQEQGEFLVHIKSCIELSNRLNLSRASVYRAFNMLETEGIILRRGKIIVIKDIEKLQVF